MKMEKTIEERAYKAVPDMLRINENYVASFVSGYCQGAREQHEIDIEKACAWLRESLTRYAAIKQPMNKIIEDFLSETK